MIFEQLFDDIGTCNKIRAVSVCFLPYSVIIFFKGLSIGENLQYVIPPQWLWVVLEPLSYLADPTALRKKQDLRIRIMRRDQVSAAVEDEIPIFLRDIVYLKKQQI